MQPTIKLQVYTSWKTWRQTVDDLGYLLYVRIKWKTNYYLVLQADPTSRTSSDAIVLKSTLAYLLTKQSSHYNSENTTCTILMSVFAKAKVAVTHT